MKFVIIGGDAAGMSAASRAKRQQPDLEVIVLEQTPDVSYSACGMPYNIADPDRDMDDLVVRHAQVFRDKAGIDLRTEHRITAIDPTQHTVTGISGDGQAFQMPYDRLLIATGATPIIPELPGFDLEGVMALKSLVQGRAIKAFLKSRTVKKTVILGMGYIAMEMCEALRGLSIEVQMVKPRPELLPWLAPELAETVRKELRQNQVQMTTGYSVERIERSGNGLQVRGSNGDLAADMVLLAMGVRPRSELASAAGLTLGPHEAISVDRQMRTSDSTIYAAGDCADAFHVVSGQRVWIPLALRANRAGWAVADHLTGRPVDLPGVAGTAVFKVFDLQVARTGLTAAEAVKAGFDPATVTITGSTRSHPLPGAGPIKVHMVGDKSSGRLLGAQMVGRENAAHRINAVVVALHAGLSVDQFSQSDLSYAPPFGPTWDPLLVAANQLVKRL